MSPSAKSFQQTPEAVLVCHWLRQCLLVRTPICSVALVEPVAHSVYNLDEESSWLDAFH